MPQAEGSSHSIATVWSVYADTMEGEAQDTELLIPANAEAVEAYSRLLNCWWSPRGFVLRLMLARRRARMRKLFYSLPICEGREAWSVETDDTELEPPWVTIPGYPAASMCWRMGGGEDVSWKFQRRYRALTESERAEFRERYPEPEGWEGWLDMVTSVGDET